MDAHNVPRFSFWFRFLARCVLLVAIFAGFMNATTFWQKAIQEVWDSQCGFHEAGVPAETVMLKDRQVFSFEVLADVQCALLFAAFFPSFVASDPPDSDLLG
jgi:hypothetical protein